MSPHAARHQHSRSPLRHRHHFRRPALRDLRLSGRQRSGPPRQAQRHDGGCRPQRLPRFRHPRDAAAGSLAGVGQSPARCQLAGLCPALNVSNKQTTESYCLDPRMIAAHTSYVKDSNGNFVPRLLPATTPTGNLGGQCVQYFPYQEPFGDQNSNCIADSSDQYSGQSDLNNNGVHDPPTDQRCAEPDELRVPLCGSTARSCVASRCGTAFLRRASAGLKWPMSWLQANSVFTIGDDLSYERPEDDKSKPAAQAPFCSRRAARPTPRSGSSVNRTEKSRGSRRWFPNSTSRASPAINTSCRS